MQGRTQTIWTHIVSAVFIHFHRTVSDLAVLTVVNPVCQMFTRTPKVTTLMSVFFFFFRNMLERYVNDEFRAVDRDFSSSEYYFSNLCCRQLVLFVSLWSHIHMLSYWQSFLDLYFLSAYIYVCRLMKEEDCDWHEEQEGNLGGLMCRHER